jgi:hydrogenase expression/formation protein HypD
MQLLTEFRRRDHAAGLRRALAAAAPARRVRLMEICGTHTMAVFRSGLRAFLPATVELVSGPGCPVCVTDARTIDLAIAHARDPEVHLVTFGDMLRVPGSSGSLEEARARGARVTVAVSPLDTLAAARAEPERTAVFFAVGFETTAPAIAALAREAMRQELPNVAILCAMKRVPPAMAALAGAGELAIDGFICPAHVSAVIGADAYTFLARDYRRPCVIAGFEPLDILYGVHLLLEQLAAGRAAVENEYGRVVARGGNPAAQALIDEVFEPVDAPWRGLGTIPLSGYGLKAGYAALDLERRRPLAVAEPRPLAGCLCGTVLRGAAAPEDCALFGRACTLATPVGPCMVSSEGTCAAHLRYAALGAAAGEPAAELAAAGAGR